MGEFTHQIISNQCIKREDLRFTVCDLLQKLHFSLRGSVHNTVTAADPWRHVSQKMSLLRSSLLSSQKKDLQAPIPSFGITQTRDL